MKKDIKKDLNSIYALSAFIEYFAGVNKLNSDTCFALNLAAEEIFTNLIKYNAKTKNDIRIRLSKKKDQVVLSLTDFDVDAFDINQIKVYDIHQPLRERPIGKLGIHLVKKLMDKVDYKYKNRNSTITLIKYVRDVYV